VKNLRFSSGLDYCPPWANRLSIIAERLIGHPTRRLRRFVVYVCYINVYIRNASVFLFGRCCQPRINTRETAVGLRRPTNASAKAKARRPNYGAGNYDAAYPRCKTALTSATNVTMSVCVASHAHPRNKPRRSPRNVQRECLGPASVGSRLEQHFVLDSTILRVRSTLPGGKTSLP